MAAPELRLEVSLNLVGFRAEVKKLTNIAQSEFTPKINVKFNRSTLNQELNNLQAAIKRRTYRIEIGGNIDKLPDKIKDLKQQLASLESFKVDLGIGAVKSLSKQDAKKIKNDLRAEILGEQKKIYVPLSIKPAITRQDVRDFKNAVQSKLTGLTVKVKADLEAASISSGAKSQSDIDADVRRGLQAISEIGAARMAKGAGGVTESARREQLKQALSQGGFDLAALKDIGKQLGVSRVGRFKRIDTLINRIVAEASIEMVKKYLDPQAVMRNTDRSALGKVLDTLARGIFNMLGMDPASIRAQQAERRRIPSISWQASVPSQGGLSGPSSTGRALPPGATPMGLPGTAFASQKRLVGDILSPSLKDALRGAANAFVDSVRRELNAAVRSVSVKDLGPPVRAALSAGAGGRPPLMLPPAGGTGANRVRITTGSFTGRGYEPPGGFPSDGRLGGKQGPSTFIGAGSQMEKFKTVLDVASASTRNFRASQIPLIGGLKELGGEFGLAAKQVLLYGTAYKGLAFITGLPGQILNAAKSQQQFNNALKTATQDTGTFAKELLYVDNVQRAFGLNLETTRTGFTKLYASMAPTGFDSGSIEKLFTGISAATAALQLTPDKAERVIYAFGQMASKGQIMSEELKGQLGDVLPGALAIFSKAAGMSVKEFSKAMEDGEFKGNRFREVFAKVSDELMNRFGTGAQAAGKSLQGLINTVGGDFQRTLESFAPLANTAAQATLGPLTGMLREISVAAQIAMGEQDRVRKQLEAAQSDVSALKTGGADAKEIKAAEQNVAALTARYESLNEAAKDPAIAQQVKNIEAFVIEVQKAATFTKNLAEIIGNVLSPVFTFLGGNLTSVIGNLALLVLGFNAVKLASLLFTGTLTTLNAVVAAGGSISTVAAAKSTILAGAFRLVGVQATGAQVATIGFGAAVKGLLISTGIGALVVLLGSLAASALSVGDAFSAAANKAKQSIDEMKDAVRTGNVALAKSQLSSATQARNDIEEQVKYLESMKVLFKQQGGKGRPFVETNLERRMRLENAGFTLKNAAGPNGRTDLDINDLLGQASTLRKLALNTQQRGVASVRLAAEKAGTLGLNKPDPAAAQAEDALQDTKTTNLESYYSLQDQLAKDAAEFAAAQAEEESRHRMALLELYYDTQEARANAYQKDALKFEREMVMIEERRQEARLKAQLEVQKAQASVAGGVGGGKGLGAGIAQYITGDPASPFYKADHGGGNYHEHLAFVSREAAEEAYRKLTSAGIKVTEFKGKSRVGGHTPGSAHYKGLAFDVPGAQVPVGRERELTARVQSILGIGAGGAGAARKVTGDEKRDELAAQNTIQASIAKTRIERMADEKAVREQIVALEQYRAVAFPTVEQTTQNELLAKRNELFRSGLTDDQIDLEIKLYENQKRGAAALDVVQRLYDKGYLKLDAYNKLLEVFNKDIADQNNLLQQNATYLRQAKFDQALKGIRDQIDMARAFTPDQEMRVQIAQDGFTGAEAESIFQEQKTLEKAQKLKEDLKGIASAISDSFAEAFKGIVSGSMTAQQALASFFQSVGDYFIDMAARIIAEYLKMQLIKGLVSLIGGAIGGGLTSGFSGSAAGFGGSFDAGIPAIGNTTDFSGAFKFANGGIAPGGFQAFASGGIVTGPTLGLVGEGRYNEAVIPLPDGKSVPVKLSGGTDSGMGSTDRMQSAMMRYSQGVRNEATAQGFNDEGADGSALAAGGIATIDVRYNVERINNIEYVTAAEFQAGMRQAAQQGAAQGEQRTLRKLQQSPSIRKRIGV